MLFGPMQRAVANQEKQRAHDRARDPVLAPRTIAAQTGPRQQDSTCNGVAYARGEQRRNGFNRVANRQVG